MLAARHARRAGRLPLRAAARSLCAAPPESERQQRQQQALARKQQQREQRQQQRQQQQKEQQAQGQKKKRKKKEKPVPPGPPINLPQTEFPMRANAAVREPTFLARCTTDLYAWQERERPADGPRFVLHDGPPFANGVPHMGHALNKVIKDIVNRYRLLRGDRISYVPGWDCHGLPIELKALQRLPKGSSRSSELSAVAVRKVARREAEAAIEAQREQFERWGVMGDWDHSYRTMTPQYEAGQLRVFRRMVEKGLIYRALRPVYWSPSSMTALAEAELEYNDAHCSRAVYVRFPVVGNAVVAKLQASGMGLDDCNGLSLVAWTTTPWSLVGNQALCVNPDLEYSVVRSDSRDWYVVATALLAELEEAWGGALEVKGGLRGTDMVGWECEHPLPSVGGPRPVLPGAHVTAESGTGVVHTAPAHGHDDFIVCKEHGIDPLCPIDDRGHFTEDEPAPWAGQEALGEGVSTVVSELKDAGMLVAEHDYIHSYAYDWRTKKPVLTRATQQWFADLSDLQQEATAALADVEISPPSGRKRLGGMVATRKEVRTNYSNRSQSPNC